MSLSHRQLAACYLQLGQQLGAGLTFSQALAAPSPIPATDRLRLVQLIEQGHPLSAVLDAAGDWLPCDDRPFLIAAASTGRLPVILQSLSERHEHLGKLQMRVLLACLYPVGVLHLGALVFSFFRLIDWNTGIHWDAEKFGLGVLVILGPFWGGALLLTGLIKMRFPPALALLNLLPAIGGYRRNQALADFAFALGHLLSAGAPIGSAWASAAEIANSPRIAKAAAAIAQNIQNRESPGAHIGEHAVFPHDFAVLYQSGEATGSLDQNLLHLAELHQAKAHHRLTVASMLYPGILFFAVAGMVMYIVVSFYAGYLKNITDMIGN